jgi:N-carbamoyl-L-amino-acid hydrolase
MKLDIEQDRLAAELDALGAISQEPLPVVTRVVFTEADVEARNFVKKLCQEAGLAVREDAVGNTFARWMGENPDLEPVATGSHIDAIPHAGRFDGTVGVLGALEAIRALMRADYRPHRCIELVIFTSEEPTRFGIGCLGSRLLTGRLDPETAGAMKDRDGVSLDDARWAAGFEASLASVPLAPGYYAAFVELHIEQGPLLERHNVPIGVVTAIAAPASLRIVIQGEGGHAGAVLMPDRHDAFLAAAEIALAVEQAAQSSGSIDTVGTTGVCDVFPGAVNSVPSRVRMEIDVRDIDEDRRDAALHKIKLACEEIANRRGVQTNLEIVNADSPAHCDPRVLEALIESCKIHNLPFERMISRAYHDSLFMSRIAPTAMLFIPCRNGVSHRPDEYASPEAMAQGALALAETLAHLAAI